MLLRMVRLAGKKLSKLLLASHCKHERGKTEKFKQELVDNRAKLVEDVVQMGKDVDEFIQLGEIELVEERVVCVDAAGPLLLLQLSLL